MKNWKSVLISILLIVVTTVLLLYLASLNFLSVFVKDALWASVLATIVLVIINAFVLLQNRQTIREMEKARKVEFMPHVRVELSWLGPMALILKATNFGKGPAVNIKAEITFLPSNIKRKWNETIFSPSEFIRIMLPDANVHNVCLASAEIDVMGEYQDIFGQNYKIAERIQTKEFIDDATQLVPILERNEVAEALKDMKKELHDVAYEIRGMRQISEKIGQIVDKLDEIVRKEEK